MAAVRINQIDESVGTPSGQIESRVNPIVNPAANIDLSGFANYANRLSAAKEESDVLNARAELAALEPQAQLDFQAEYNRVEASWAPGQKPMAEQMRDYIKTYTQDVEANLQNPRTAELVRARSNELATVYMLKSGAQQLGIERDVRIGSYSSTYDNIALLGVNDPDSVGLNLARQNQAVMEDEQIPYQQRLELVKNGAQTVAVSVAKVQADENPAKTLAVIGGILGLTQPQMTVPGDDLVAAITKRESGNRLYDASGKILRGPAITTANGSVIHAVGKYQLLESTAKAQAKRMGVEWKPDVFFRDRTGNAQQDQETSDYHDLLGQGHIADNLQRFGNPVVVAAAHNMGPEAAEGWAAGRPYQTQSGKWWHPDKPMDLNAMPAETRKYIEGVGSVEEVATATQDEVGSEYATAFRLLNPEQLLSIYGSAQSRMAEISRAQKERQDIEKGFFQQELNDITTAAKSGDDFNMPSDDKFALLGPVQGALQKQRLAGLKVMAGQLNSQKGMSNQALEAQTLIPDPEGVADRENRQLQVNALRTNAKAILAQRQSDPGLAASQNEQVMAAQGRWMDAANAFYSAGAQATPEQLAEVNAAQGDYVNASFAVQRQWGVLNPKLPKSMAEQIGGGFNRMMKDGNVMAASARMAVLPRQMGGSYDAIEEVAKQTGDVGRFAMEGVPPGVLNTLYQSRQLKVEELNGQLGNTKPADVQSAVARTFAPLLSSLSASGPDGAGDSGAAARYLSNGTLLAKTYLASGKASSPNEAAQLAYTDLYANRETITPQGLRVPNSLNPDEVVSGLGRKAMQITPEQIQVTPMVGFTDDEVAQRTLRAIQINGRWVTDETGEGAYLMVGGKPVLDRSGNPIQSTYKQALQTKGTNRPSVPSLPGKL